MTSTSTQMTILDEIRYLVRDLNFTPIFIVSNSYKPPEVDITKNNNGNRWCEDNGIWLDKPNSSSLEFDTLKIFVGDKWFNEEQWAKLMVLRLNNEISFEKQKDESLLIVESYGQRSCYNGYPFTGGIAQSQPFPPVWKEREPKYYTYTSSITNSSITNQPHAVLGDTYA